MLLKPVIYLPGAVRERGRTILEVWHNLKKLQGRRYRRICLMRDIQDLITAIEQHPDARVIRVYGGFVANRYAQIAITTMLEAKPGKSGAWRIETLEVDAHRVWGRGAYLTVNGR